MADRLPDALQGGMRRRDMVGGRLAMDERRTGMDNKTVLDVASVAAMQRAVKAARAARSRLRVVGLCSVERFASQPRAECWDRVSTAGLGGIEVAGRDFTVRVGGGSDAGGSRRGVGAAGVGVAGAAGGGSGDGGRANCVGAWYDDCDAGRAGAAVGAGGAAGGWDRRGADRGRSHREELRGLRPHARALGIARAADRDS